MQDILKVKDIMTSGWIATLNPHDSLIHAAKLFGQYNYDGFPVIDKDKKLLGVVTAYDLISDQSLTHLKSLNEILNKIINEEEGISEKDIEDHYRQLESVKVEDVMNTDPLTVGPDLSIEDLAKEFSKHHRVNPIPVIDDKWLLVGVVSRYDLIHFFDRRYLDKVMVSNGHELLLQKIGQLSNKTDK